MGQDSEKVHFLSRPSVTQVDSGDKGFVFQASISAKAKNTLIADLWTGFLLHRGYLLLERHYEQVVFFRQSLTWRSVLFRTHPRVSFIALRVAAKPGQGSKAITLHTFNEPQDVLNDFIIEINHVLSLAKPSLGGGAKRSELAAEIITDEGYLLYSAIMQFSSSLFTLKYALGRSLSQFLARLDQRRQDAFLGLYQFILQARDVLCKDYNVNSLDARWIFLYCFEVVERIISQFFFASIVRLYSSCSSPGGDCKPGGRGESLDSRVVEALADAWCLFACESSMMQKLFYMDEIHYTARLMLGAMQTSEKAEEWQLYVSAGFLAARGRGPLLASARMVRDFADQTQGFVRPSSGAKAIFAVLSALVTE